MPIRVRLGPADLARVRFALSPTAEVVSSLLLLHDHPSGSDDLHRIWRRRVGAALSGKDRDLLLGLVPPPGTSCIPDFLTPSPATTRPSFDQQLATVRATPLEQVRADLNLAFEARRVPAAYLPWFEREPDSLLDAASAAFGRYWYEALNPHWTAIRDVLESDLHYRARRLAETGLEGLFADLHPLLRFDRESLLIGTPHSVVTDADARGLVFIPSVFIWPRLAVGGAPGGPIVISYPARGVAATWSARAPAAGEALSKVLGEYRARLLTDLGEPRATEELSRRHGVSPSTVSYHLTALRDAGLLARRRASHRVLYHRTHLGDLLVQEASAAR